MVVFGLTCETTWIGERTGGTYVCVPDDGGQSTKTKAIRLESMNDAAAANRAAERQQLIMADGLGPEPATATCHRAHMEVVDCKLSGWATSES